MSDIFLCYGSEDREQVRILAEALTQEGWSVSWNRTIPVEKTWKEVFEAELAATRGLVVLWSAKSAKRKWLIEEVEEGIRRRLPIFQALIDRVSPPLQFQSRQSVNLSGWDGGTNSLAFQSLVRHIRQILGQPSPQEAPEPESAPEPPELRPPVSRKMFNTIGMRFVLIPAGTFLMGTGPSEVGDEDELPQHQVTLSQPFYLQTTPVTQGQWVEVMGENPAYFHEGGPDCPVENVSWEEAQEFITKLNDQEGTDEYRLPTEAEWEYACRAGSSSQFCYGEEEADLKNYAWYEANSGECTHPVALLRPNAWGLYDLHGNVFEWCQDWFGAYPSEPVTHPQGPADGEHRVLRGGSWNSAAEDVRCAYRHRLTPGYRYRHEGFRVARDV
jgi:formylglycine-generating enzyme required for sulfatase activity